MKQTNKDLSMVFFNSVEEMNECYDINAELPSDLHSNTDLVCYEIVEPFVFKYMGQYFLLVGGFYHLNNLGKVVVTGFNGIKSESDVHASDCFGYEGRCFVYVRVNEYLRKHLEKTLIGCEFIYKKELKESHERRFIHYVYNTCNGVVVQDQNDRVQKIGSDVLEVVEKKLSEMKGESSNDNSK